MASWGSSRSCAGAGLNPAQERALAGFQQCVQETGAHTAQVTELKENGMVMFTGAPPDVQQMQECFYRHGGWTRGLEPSRPEPPYPTAPPPTRTFHAPSRDGSLSDQVVYAYFTDSPPAAATSLRSTVNPNMPRGVQDFHVDWDPAVALFLALRHEGRTFRIVSRWYDERGVERKVIERTMAQAGVTGRWTWQTHVVPAGELAPHPGSWTVKVSVDEALVGEYRFTLAGGSGGARR